MRQCETCLYWQPDIDDIGYCRLNPPTPISPVMSRFPCTRSISYCFQWKSVAGTHIQHPEDDESRGVKRGRGRPRKDKGDDSQAD